MEVIPLNDYLCPLCAAPLELTSATYRCAKGHAFDQAREGYVNLLPVQNKGSLDPGDNAPMVEARRRFLERGHFEPIARAAAAMAGQRPARVLDAGCGEGYYLNYLAGKFREGEMAGGGYFAGIDISKWAVKAAAKKYKQIAWAVASNRNLPFRPASLDLILCIFGFPFWQEFARMQSTGGMVLLVDPGPAHLIELRKIIYPKVNETTAPSLQEGLSNGYILAKEKTICFTFPLNGQEEIQDLLAMTPHAHRISPPGRQALEAITKLTVTAEVNLRALKRI